MAALKSGAAAFVGALPKGYDTMLGRSFDEEGQDHLGGPVAEAGQRPRLLPRSLRAGAGRAAFRVRREGRCGGLQEVPGHVPGQVGPADLPPTGHSATADCIVCLERGRIVEQGTYDELIALNGPYARLYSIQANGTAERRCDVITEMTGGPCS